MWPTGRREHAASITSTPHGLGALRAWLDQFWDQALAAFQAEIEMQGEQKDKGQMTMTSEDCACDARAFASTQRRRTRSKCSLPGWGAGGRVSMGSGKSR